MNNRELEPRSFRAQVQRVQADSNTIPSLGAGESFGMTVAPFPDHGRPCYVGSAIRSNRTFFDLARNLTPEESKRANDSFRSEVERILSGEEIRAVGVLSAKNKPDIFSVIVGRPFDPKSLRLYYTKSEFMGAPAIFQIAISRVVESRRIEAVLQKSGYGLAKKTAQSKRVH